MTGEARRNDIRDVHKEYPWVYPVVLAIALLGIGIWIGASIFADKDGYAMNIVTELLGIGATVFIIDQFRAYRDKESLKRRLLREAGSRSRDIAIAAVEWLNDKNWLIGDKGVLKGAKLDNANLQGAWLVEANLQGARLKQANLHKAELVYAQMQYTQLQYANLQYAKLVDADLRNTRLFGANMRDAKLIKANMRGADMQKVDLQTAFLHSADLRDVKLQNANLQGATLHEAKLHGAILPDGQSYTESIDLTKYTNPGHPDYHDYSVSLRKERSLHNTHISPS